MNKSDRNHARSEIIETLHLYAHLAVEGADLDKIAELWTPEGKFVLPGGVAVPPQELRKIVGNHPPKYVRHHITTIVVEFDDDYTARADSYFIAYSDLAQPDHWGRWLDVLKRCDDGVWRFERKEPVVEGVAPDGDFAKIMADREANQPS